MPKNTIRTYGIQREVGRMLYLLDSAPTASAWHGRLRCSSRSPDREKPAVITARADNS